MMRHTKLVISIVSLRVFSNNTASSSKNISLFSAFLHMEQTTEETIRKFCISIHRTLRSSVHFEGHIKHIARTELIKVICKLFCISVHRELRISNSLSFTPLVRSFALTNRASFAFRNILATELLIIDGVYFITIFPALIPKLFIDFIKSNNNSRTLISTKLNSSNVRVIFNISALRGSILILAEEAEFIPKPSLNLSVSRQVKNQLTGMHIRAYNY